MGIVTLFLLISLETFFLFWSINTKSNHREEKSVVSIALLVLFGLLLCTGVYEWSFRYVAFLIVLVIQAIAGAITLIKKRKKEFKLGKRILSFTGNCFIFTFALFIAVLCPQYEQPKTTGNYTVTTAKYTWTDEGRVDKFSQSGENRALTVEFWYPENADSTYPLIVFSHGAFGFSGSNYSTFAELASNGYVVASIGHTYHAFYTMDTDGKVTIVDAEFINKASQINAVNDPSREEEIFNTTREWMTLRTEDENFVLDAIFAECNNNNNESPFSIINTDKIGLMGHSLGGATSAQVGRDRDDIDAVIVLDGTMLGEEIAFQNNKIILNDTPYPIPILNVYAEDHYIDSKSNDGEAYANFNATKNAVSAYETVFKNAGHLNFTDLPLFSPALAKMLGVGTIDELYCIEKMNEVVLEFFNCFLKDTGVLKIAKEY